MNGVYWGLAALELRGAGAQLEREALVEFVLQCWDNCTGAHPAW